MKANKKKKILDYLQPLTLTAALAIILVCVCIYLLNENSQLEEQVGQKTERVQQLSSELTQYELKLEAIKKEREESDYLIADYEAYILEIQEELKKIHSRLEIAEVSVK